jgi:signal transduction histidine kinase/HPt (histidine-containing phosphotransfer) domain-containing protein/ActR/RegA family two-component response regulator
LSGLALLATWSAVRFARRLGLGFALIMLITVSFSLAFPIGLRVGIHAQSLTMLTLGILLAGLIYGPREAKVTTWFSVVMVSVLYAAELFHWFGIQTPQPPVTAPIMRFANFVALYVGSGWLVASYGRLFHQTMQRQQETLSQLNASVAEMSLARVELQERTRQAEAASVAKSQFLATMSHEIRTPMNGVTGMADLLLDSQLSAQQRQYAEVIASSASSLLKIINDILDYSKVEAGRMELEQIDFNIHRLLDELCEFYVFRAAENGLVFSSSISPVVPLWVKGDPTRLRQILTNFLGNAFKFTVSGSVRLEVSVVADQDRCATLRFVVKDTGIGIPAPAQQKLFSAFTQADGSTTRQFGGTGLGLAISRQLAELMQGRVGLESVEFEGSTFWAEIPFEQGSETTPPVPLHDPGMSIEIPGAGAVRLLLVEDNPTNQLVAVGLLKRLGFVDVVVANNGNEAIEQCSRERFDAVLMDCQMPVLDGYQATRQLRERGFSVPIIAMTANVMRGDREQCLAIGMNDYIGKPIDPVVLRAVLGHWLGAAPAVGVKPELPASSETSGQVPVFDRQAALRLMADDEDILRMAIDAGMVDIPQALNALAEALKAGLAADARRQAHTIKSVAASIGGAALRSLAATAERLAEQEQLAEVEAMLPALESALADFRREAGHFTSPD